MASLVGRAQELVSEVTGSVHEFAVPYDTASAPYVAARLALTASGLAASIFMTNKQGLTLPVVGMFADWAYRQGMEVRDDFPGIMREVSE